MSERLSRLYLAGPLFSTSEKMFNAELKRILSPYFSVYLPQEDGGLMVEMIKDGVSPQVAAHRVFTMDIDAIEKCEILLIILDGRAVDEGASFELGFAFARGKECFGLRTDSRQLLPEGNNPMIESSLRQVFGDLPTLIAWARGYAMGNTASARPCRKSSILFETFH